MRAEIVWHTRIYTHLHALARTQARALRVPPPFPILATLPLINDLVDLPKLRVETTKREREREEVLSRDLQVSIHGSPNADSAYILIYFIDK